MSRAQGNPRVATGMNRQLATRRRTLSRGATAIGWKVGFGSPSAHELMQITSPLVGYLTSSTKFESGAQIAVTGWKQAMVEFEVAVYIGADLDAGAGEEDIRSAISALGPAIELADVDLPVEAAGIEAILARNIFHKGVILGDPDENRAGLDITDLVARVLIDGQERFTTRDLQTIAGSHTTAVATVANTLSAGGEMLRAGDVIITGSIFQPIHVTESTEFTFALDPFDPISVEIDRSRG
ncbi:MAG: fumarylacetoacetate hydrolase family protein [Acidimicrobiia bacterium]|nr:fumarylacetoacetate hydrolase family protein [Acidimicrobiia bacterium]